MTTGSNEIPRMDRYDVCIINQVMMDQFEEKAIKIVEAVSNLQSINFSVDDIAVDILNDESVTYTDLAWTCAYLNSAYSEAMQKASKDLLGSFECIA